MRLITRGGLALTPVTPADAQKLHDLWTAPAVRRFLWDDEVIPCEQTMDVVRTSERLFREQRFGIWGVRPAEGDLIGFGGFWYFREPPVLELLFGIAEKQWNRGHATDIAARLLDYGFATLDMTVIRASTDEDNTASVRVLEKLGFSRTLRAVVGGRRTLFFERTPEP